MGFTFVCLYCWCRSRTQAHSHSACCSGAWNQLSGVQGLFWPPEPGPAAPLCAQPPLEAGSTLPAPLPATTPAPTGSLWGVASLVPDWEAFVESLRVLTRVFAPSQSSEGDGPALTEVDLFISTQRIKVLNADTQVSGLELGPCTPTSLLSASYPLACSCRHPLQWVE